MSAERRGRQLERICLELAERVAGCVREADGLDLARLRIVSPFDRRLKYNLYSCFRIIPAHQRQHLLQAEEAIRSIRA